MKTHPVSLLLSCFTLAVGSVSCSSLFILESDYATSADIPAYTSFEFTRIDRYGPDSISPYIEGEIRAQLAYRGYHRHYKPDFLVTYALFNENCELPGLLQPPLLKPVPATAGANVTPQNADSRRYLLKTGTLLIQVVDARRYAVVWQGYASGFHHDRRVPVEKRARRFVRNIFDRYPFFARDFLTANRPPAPADEGGTR